MSDNRKFLKPLPLAYDHDWPRADKWIVTEELIYHVGNKDSDDLVIVPLGFRTDLASVPWPMSMLFPKSGKWNHAAVVHDFLCVYPDRPQAEIDVIFLEIMEVLGVKKWKRELAYRGVVIYQKYRARVERRSYYGAGNE